MRKNVMWKPYTDLSLSRTAVTVGPFPGTTGVVDELLVKVELLVLDCAIECTTGTMTCCADNVSSVRSRSPCSSIHTESTQCQTDQPDVVHHTQLALTLRRILPRPIARCSLHDAPLHTNRFDKATGPQPATTASQFYTHVLGTLLREPAQTTLVRRPTAHQRRHSSDELDLDMPYNPTNPTTSSPSLTYASASSVELRRQRHTTRVTRARANSASSA